MHYVRKDGSYYEGDRERADDQLVPARPDASYTFDGWQWVLPPEVAVQIEEVSIDQARVDAISAGITFAGHVFDTDPQSLINVVATVTAINAGMALPDGFVWRSKDNVNVPMTADDMKKFLTALVLTGFQIYAASWAQKDQAVAGVSEVAIPL